MKLIRTEDAVGHVLCHDITQIIPGVTKDAVFRKGHVAKEEDIPVLLSVGKEHLYVWENDDTMLHENDAAQVLYEICAGDQTRIHGSAVKEGKIELIADEEGLLKIRRENLKAVNSLGDMMIASIHGDFPVKKGDKLAGTRVIPLVIKKERMEQARKAAGSEPIFTILPFQKKNAAVLVTGSEVQKGLIEDAFSPVVVSKLAEYGSQVTTIMKTGDDKDNITRLIQEQITAGADLVICTGGMSVDPDDCTPGAIKNSGAEIISYGSPVLPGAMLLIAYMHTGGRMVPIVGLPGCAMYSKRTVFDLVLPRILADDPITADELASLGEGGLCLGCSVCTFPKCSFGR